MFGRVRRVESSTTRRRHYQASEEECASRDWFHGFICTETGRVRPTGEGPAGGHLSGVGETAHDLRIRRRPHRPTGRRIRNALLDRTEHARLVGRTRPRERAGPVVGRTAGRPPAPDRTFLRRKQSAKSTTGPAVVRQCTPCRHHCALAGEHPGTRACHRGSAGECECANQIEVSHLFPEGSTPAAEGSGVETFQAATRNFQADLLARRLAQHEWNVSETARALDLTRSHVYNLIGTFGLKRS
jgi:hypothetical protein